MCRLRFDGVVFETLYNLDEGSHNTQCTSKLFPLLTAFTNKKLFNSWPRHRRSHCSLQYKYYKLN